MDCSKKGLIKIHNKSREQKATSELSRPLPPQPAVRLEADRRLAASRPRRRYHLRATVRTHSRGADDAGQQCGPNALG